MQWMMLQQEQARDYVIATGQQYSVREFVNIAANQLKMELHWEGSGIDERALDQNGREVVCIDPRYFRPAEVETLLGDATKARQELGWVPKTSFLDLVTEMVSEDLKAAERDVLVSKHGYDAYQKN
jgi:GDPmannose 4,6-dehydratase